jgi:hypothetical protein
MVLGLDRSSLPIGRDLAARKADRDLLWTWAPQFAQRICRPSTAYDQAKVLIIGLDEAQEEFKNGWESERWPLGQILKREGCAASQDYPMPKNSPLTELFSGQGHTSICRTSTFDNDTQLESFTTHIIVTFYSPERKEELRQALFRAHPCAWQVEEEREFAWVLRRQR